MSEVAADASYIVAQRKQSMCGKKASFTTRAAAERRAASFNQRVYECPVCFCWHCTSKENWREEYVPVERVNGLVEAARNEGRSGKKAEIAALNCRINELRQENASLRKRIREMERAR